MYWLRCITFSLGGRSIPDDFTCGCGVQIFSPGVANLHFRSYRVYRYQIPMLRLTLTSSFLRHAPTHCPLHLSVRADTTEHLTVQARSPISDLPKAKTMTGWHPFSLMISHTRMHPRSLIIRRSYAFFSSRGKESQCFISSTASSTWISSGITSWAFLDTKPWNSCITNPTLPSVHAKTFHPGGRSCDLELGTRLILTVPGSMQTAISMTSRSSRLGAPTDATSNLCSRLIRFR